MTLPDESRPAGPEYLILGAALAVFGMWLIHCYFERSGRDKPFLAKLILPG